MTCPFNASLGPYIGGTEEAEKAIKMKFRPKNISQNFLKEKSLPNTHLINIRV